MRLWPLGDNPRRASTGLPQRPLMFLPLLAPLLRLLLGVPLGYAAFGPLGEQSKDDKDDDDPHTDKLARVDGCQHVSLVYHPDVLALVSSALGGAPVPPMLSRICVSAWMFRIL